MKQIMTVREADRYEIAPADEQTGLVERSFQFLDTARGRGEFLAVRFSEADHRNAIVRNELRDTRYALSYAGGRWHCTCPAGASNRRCYHVRTVEGAVQIIRGEGQ